MNMKKYLVWGLIIVLASGLFLCRKTLVSKLSPGFRFEKYKTAEDAKRALLQLHPVGSDVDDLIETLKKIGVDCKVDHTQYGTFTTGEYVQYKALFGYDWGVRVKHSEADEKKIEFIVVWKHYDGF